MRPINALLIAGLAPAKIGLDRHLRFKVPLLGIQPWVALKLGVAQS